MKFQSSFARVECLFERIQELIGELAFPEKELKVFASPGQLKSHYAPHADLLLFEEGALARIDPASVPAHAAALAFDTSMAEQLRRRDLF